MQLGPEEKVGECWQRWREGVSNREETVGRDSARGGVGVGNGRLHRKAGELTGPEQEVGSVIPAKGTWHHPKMPVEARQATEIEEASPGRGNREGWGLQ